MSIKVPDRDPMQARGGQGDTVSVYPTTKA